MINRNERFAQKCAERSRSLFVKLSAKEIFAGLKSEDNRSTHFKKYMQHAEHLTYQVTTDILSKHKIASLKKVLNKWYERFEHLVEMHDLHDAKAIRDAFYQKEIERLPIPDDAIEEIKKKIDACLAKIGINFMENPPYRTLIPAQQSYSETLPTLCHYVGAFVSLNENLGNMHDQARRNLLAMYNQGQIATLVSREGLNPANAQGENNIYTLQALGDDFQLLQDEIKFNFNTFFIRKEIITEIKVIEVDGIRKEIEEEKVVLNYAVKVPSGEIATDTISEEALLKEVEYDPIISNEIAKLFANTHDLNLAELEVVYTPKDSKGKDGRKKQPKSIFSHILTIALNRGHVRDASIENLLMGIEKMRVANEKIVEADKNKKTPIIIGSAQKEKSNLVINVKESPIANPLFKPSEIHINPLFEYKTEIKFVKELRNSVKSRCLKSKVSIDKKDILKKTTCDILVSSSKPTKANIAKLKLQSEAAYIRCPDTTGGNYGLYYINPTYGWCIPFVNLSKAQLDKFDEIVANCPNNIIDAKKLKEIEKAIGFSHKNTLYPDFQHIKKQVKLKCKVENTLIGSLRVQIDEYFYWLSEFFEPHRPIVTLDDSAEDIKNIVKNDAKTVQAAASERLAAQKAKSNKVSSICEEAPDEKMHAEDKKAESFEPLSLLEIVIAEEKNSSKQEADEEQNSSTINDEFSQELSISSSESDLSQMSSARSNASAYSLLSSRFDNNSSSSLWSSASNTSVNELGSGPNSARLGSGFNSRNSPRFESNLFNDLNRQQLVERLNLIDASSSDDEDSSISANSKGGVHFDEKLEANEKPVEPVSNLNQTNEVVNKPTERSPRFSTKERRKSLSALSNLVIDGKTLTTRPKGNRNSVLIASDVAVQAAVAPAQQISTNIAKPKDAAQEPQQKNYGSRILSLFSPSAKEGEKLSSSSIFSPRRAKK